MHGSETSIVEFRAFGPLTFVYYQEDGYEGLVGAHCVELDLGGQGATREEARTDLQAAIETYVIHHFEQGLAMEVRRAPPEIANLLDREQFHLFLAGLRTGDHGLRRSVLFGQPPAQFSPQTALA